MPRLEGFRIPELSRAAMARCSLKDIAALTVAVDLRNLGTCTAPSSL